MKCNNCGKETESKFCPECGTKIGEQNQEKTDLNEVDSKKNNGNTAYFTVSRILGIVLMIVGILIIIFSLLVVWATGLKEFFSEIDYIFFDGFLLVLGSGLFVVGRKVKKI